MQRIPRQDGRSSIGTQDSGIALTLGVSQSATGVRKGFHSDGALILTLHG